MVDYTHQLLTSANQPEILRNNSAENRQHLQLFV